MIVVCLTGLLTGIVSLAGLWLMGWPYALPLAALCASLAAVMAGILIALRQQGARGGRIKHPGNAPQRKRVDAAAPLPEPRRQA